MEILRRTAVTRFSKVRLVGTGINEIVSFNDALTMAEDRELDLVLVSADAKPPVVRIQDLKKIEYEKKKAKKVGKQAVSVLKEMQFKVNISEHDLGTKVSQIRKFLERGDKVKLTVRLKGRERENPERAKELLERLSQMLSEDAKQSHLPGGMMLLEPTKKTAAVKKATAS